MKIANIVGARPQFIKYFPVSRAVQKSGNVIEDILIHTGQHYHYKMSMVFFDEFGIKEPDYHLGVGSGSHGEQTGKIIQNAEKVLLKEKPDLVLVYGDTNSTLGGSLAATKLNIPVLHVEAGLRSCNKYMPEEINRILTDHASTILFCPSKTAVNNLINEGFQNILNHTALVPLNYFSQSRAELNRKIDKNSPRVVNVGDVMYDVLLYALDIAERRSRILEQLMLTKRSYYLLTVHRAENTDNQQRFEEIIKFINDVSAGKIVVFPMHPRTTKIYVNSNTKFADNIKIIEPVGYFDILMLIKNCALVMTDSGGMQKEAYWLAVPCITLREETEWVETVESGCNVFYKNYNDSHKPTDFNRTHYGDGKSAERIVSALIGTIHEEKE
ncbi:UDP-N-acetyl glucosamine 2-epimerase [bacterium]|nr:UDP-N-acetyl glucosamine 2-epimerase [bacterium]